MNQMIKINDVWKKYSKDRVFHHSIREDMMNIFSAQRRTDNLSVNEFWALENLNLSINSGEVVGLIGPNGSGKSTILKLIANITHPNKGTVSVNGRVAPIIQLGSGFHPDLTGYENIFVNGAILGMRIKEIKQKMPSILEFSEIEEFIHMPIKNYSSGMYLRLAFSIAIHSEADIYLFDEVLAVGDVNFQEKCMARIEVLKNQQKTIIFVTHDPYFIKKFAQRVVQLKKGRLVEEGR